MSANPGSRDLPAAVDATCSSPQPDLLSGSNGSDSVTLDQDRLVLHRSLSLSIGTMATSTNAIGGFDPANRPLTASEISQSRNQDCMDSSYTTTCRPSKR